MSDDRPCNRCKKHKYGSCESWECDPELIEMTNEQAIGHLAVYLDQAGMDVRLSPEDTAAIAMGIEALKKKYIVHADGRIEPEQKTGVWVAIDQEPHETWECNMCGFVIDGSGCIFPDEYRDTYKYCPNCGAKMMEVDKKMTIEQIDTILQHPKDYWSHEVEEAKEAAKKVVHILADYSETIDARHFINKMMERKDKE